MVEAYSEIFVSYKAEDRERVRPIVAALEADGLSVWWDVRISAGRNWQEEIERNLDAAKCVIVVWSKSSVGPLGGFVRDEARRAWRNNTYFGVIIDKVEPPLGFGEIQSFDLRRKSGRLSLFVSAVRARIEGEQFRSGSSASTPIISRRMLMAGGTVLAISSSAGVGWYIWAPKEFERVRVVVLPFSNLSDDPAQLYFVIGLADEIRSALTRAGLEVVGRTSSEALSDASTKKIVKALGASHILTGSIRKSSSNVRVSAQLVEGKDGLEIWSRSYDSLAGEAIHIQTTIAEETARALSVAVGIVRDTISLGGTDNFLAQEDLFQATAILRKLGTTKEALNAAIKLLESAVSRDPLFAKAWIDLGSKTALFAGLFAANNSDATNRLALAKRQIQRGLNLAPKLAEGHAALAAIDDGQLAYRSSLNGYREALNLAPNSPGVLVAALNSLPYIGSLQESQRHVSRLLSLDPLLPAAYNRQAVIFDLSRKLDDAIQAADMALRLAPQNVDARSWRSLFLIEKGLLQEALISAKSIPAGDYRKHVVKGLVAATARDPRTMRAEIDALRAQYGHYASYQFAQIHAQAGEEDAAIASLEKALQVKDPGIISALRDPFLFNLRSDKRFRRLLEKIGFPNL